MAVLAGVAYFGAAAAAGEVGPQPDGEDPSAAAEAAAAGAASSGAAGGSFPAAAPEAAPGRLEAAAAACQAAAGGLAAAAAGRLQPILAHIGQSHLLYASPRKLKPEKCTLYCTEYHNSTVRCVTVGCAPDVLRQERLFQEANEEEHCDVA